jgi:hypothetical protein
VGRICRGLFWSIVPDLSRSLLSCDAVYKSVSRSFRTGSLKREMQMIQLSTNRCSYIAVLWVSLVSFAFITLCVASQRVFIVVISLWLSPETFGYNLVLLRKDKTCQRTFLQPSSGSWSVLKYYPGIFILESRKIWKDFRKSQTGIRIAQDVYV